MADSATGSTFRAYDRLRSYDWNYEHPPAPVRIDVPDMPGHHTYCGIDVASPLAIAAGPLLNGRWILYYASLGFDILTYKTVRSGTRPCYPMPNLVPVADSALTGEEDVVVAQQQLRSSWAVSFGMPSKAPDVWRADIAWTRERLPSDKLLCVSVVGTNQEGWSIDDLAKDYARCAEWAVASGADIIEANFSCPNVSTCDADLYRLPQAARVVSETIRHAIGRTPLVLKVGHLTDSTLAASLVREVSGSATALAMTNSVPARVRTAGGERLFADAPRGICGGASRDASVAQLSRFSHAVEQVESPLRLIGVGGVDSLAALERYRSAGAEAVQIATAAMIDPGIALRIRREALARERTLL